jgi:type IV pilus assembly protein PilQ
VLSKRGSATIDPRTNQVFVTDIASKLEEVRKLIQKVDIATKQVLVEARLVEANDGFSRNLGAKLGFADLRTCAAAMPATRSTATSAWRSAAT